MTAEPRTGNAFDRLGWLLALAMMAVMFLPYIFTRGMFVDGVNYAVIARNLAAGDGSFWHMTCMPARWPWFNEHPPLAFWLNSLIYRVFGEHWIWDRAYTLGTMLVTIILLRWWWRRLFPAGHPLHGMTWLALFLWVANDAISWAYSNNLLENTLGIFTLLAVILLHQAMGGPDSERRAEGVQSEVALDAGGTAAVVRAGLWALLGGTVIAGGLLAKGPVALFPLAVPGLYWLTLSDRGWRSCGRAVAMTLLGIVGMALVLGPVLLDAAARTAIDDYLHNQLVASLKGAREANDSKLGHFYIIEILLVQTAAMSGVALATIAWGWRRGIASSSRSEGRLALFLLLVGCSASLPIAVSGKQNTWYLLPSLVWCALAAAVWCGPVLARLAADWPDRPLRRLQALPLTVIAVFAVIALARIGHDNKHPELLPDLDRIAAVVKERGEVGCADADIVTTQVVPSFLNHEAHAYLYRFWRIAIFPDANREFLLVHPGEAVPAGYDLVVQPGQSFGLVRRTK